MPQTVEQIVNTSALPIARSTDKDWHLVRAKVGIGASEMPILFGLGRISVAELLLQKRLGVQGDFEGNEFTHFGNILEPVMIAEYARRTGHLVEHNITTFLSKDHPEIFATPDAFEFYGGTGEPVFDGVRNVQVKCRRQSWGDNTPEDVVIQTQTEMVVTGLNENAIIMFASLQMQATIQKADQRIQGEIIRLAERFWNLVTSDEPFIEEDWISGSDGERKALAMLHKEMAQNQETLLPARVLGPEYVGHITEIKRMARVVERASEKKKKLENELLAASQGSSKIEISDGSRASFATVTVPARTQDAYSYVRITTNERGPK